jgi:hypothetical protein
MASDGIKNCASSQAIPSGAIRYTGPSGAGPGSEWVMLSAPDKPVVAQIGAVPKSIFGDPVPSDIFAPSTGLGTKCTLNESGKADLGLQLGVNVSTLPVSGEARTDLSNAKVLSVTVDGFEWETLQLLNFNQRLAALPQGSPYRGGGKYPVEVALSMLKVKGYVAALDVTKVSGVDLTGKYNGLLPANLTGSLSAGVTAKYDGKGHLELSVPGDAYVAGVFWSLNPEKGIVESGAAKAEPAAFVWNPQSMQIEGKR